MAWLHAFLLQREFAGSLLRRSVRPSGEVRPSVTTAEHLRRLDPNNFGVYAARPHAALTSAFNYGALLQLRYGETERAMLLCRQAIALCRMMIEGGYPVWWAEGMIEPYLNLGRLMAARGRTAAALGVYRDVLGLVTAQRITDIEGFVCDPVAIARAKQAESASPGSGLYQSAGASCLYDTFRAMATAGRPDQGLALVTAMWAHSRRELTGSIGPSQIRELACLSLMLRADYSSALKAIQRLRKQADSDISLAIACALMTAEASFGDRDTAAGVRAGHEALGYVSRLPAATPSRYVAYVLMRIATGRLAAGADCSEQLATEALAAANRAGDHSLRLRSLIILSGVESTQPTNRRQWIDPLVAAVRDNTDRLETVAALCEMARRSTRPVERAEFRAHAAILASRAGTVELEKLSTLIHRSARRLQVEAAHPDEVIARFRVAWLDADFATLMNYRPLSPEVTTVSSPQLSTVSSG